MPQDKTPGSTLRDRLSNIYVRNRQNNGDLSTFLSMLEDFITKEYQPQKLASESLKKEVILRDKIASIVAEEFKVPMDMLLIPSQKHRYTIPRFICYEALSRRGFHPDSIGELFNPAEPYNRATVKHGIETVMGMRETNFEFRCKFERIEAQLKLV